MVHDAYLALSLFLLFNVFLELFIYVHCRLMPRTLISPPTIIFHVWPLQVLTYPILLDDQSLVNEFQIFLEAIDKCCEVTLTGNHQYLVIIFLDYVAVTFL